MSSPSIHGHIKVPGVILHSTQSAFILKSGQPDTAPDSPLPISLRSPGAPGITGCHWSRRGPRTLAGCIFWFLRFGEWFPEIMFELINFFAVFFFSFTPMLYDFFPAIRLCVTIKAFVGTFSAPFVTLGAGLMTTLLFYFKRVLFFWLGLPFFRSLVDTSPYTFFSHERVTDHSVPIN